MQRRWTEHYQAIFSSGVVLSVKRISRSFVSKVDLRTPFTLLRNEELTQVLMLTSAY